MSIIEAILVKMVGYVMASWSLERSVMPKGKFSVAMMASNDYSRKKIKSNEFLNRFDVMRASGNFSKSKTGI